MSRNSALSWMLAHLGPVPNLQAVAELAWKVCSFYPSGCGETSVRWWVQNSENVPGKQEPREIELWAA